MFVLLSFYIFLLSNSTFYWGNCGNSVVGQSLSNDWQLEKSEEFTILTLKIKKRIIIIFK